MSAMGRAPISGRCYCGRIRFMAASDPISQANCHCENCRRAIGAQAVAWITVRRADFKFEQGEPRQYRTETGADRTFCDSCGTSLTYQNDSRPDEIDIITATLDHPEDFPPKKDVFPEEKLPWVPLIK